MKKSDGNKELKLGTVPETRYTTISTSEEVPLLLSAPASSTEMLVQHIQ